MSPTTPTVPVQKTPIKLAALTAVVLLAHAGLLFGTPVSLVSTTGDVSPAFSTRMIELPSFVPPAPMVRPVEPRIPSLRPLPPVAPHPRAQTVQHQFEAPTTLRDDVDAGPQDQAVVGSGIGPITQLLSADGPPSNLTQSAAPVLLAAADEQPSTAPTATAAPRLTPAPAPVRAASVKAAQVFAFAAPMHLKYKINGEIKGFPYYVNGDLQWKQDGKTYEARMEVSHFLLGSRVQTSRGELGPMGLEPTRFGDKVRSERAAHFERSKGKIVFSANSPNAPWVPGMQDQLSTFMQLGAMLGGSPASFPEGTTIPFESVGPTSVESWVFKVGPQEKLSLPAGQVSAIKLIREAMGEHDTRGELWLAPSMGYLPVRIRLTESNGNFVDQKWSDTVSP